MSLSKGLHESDLRHLLLKNLYLVKLFVSLRYTEWRLVVEVSTKGLFHFRAAMLCSVSLSD